MHMLEEWHSGTGTRLLATQEVRLQGQATASPRLAVVRIGRHIPVGEVADELEQHSPEPPANRHTTLITTSFRVYYTFS